MSGSSDAGWHVPGWRQVGETLAEQLAGSGLIALDGHLTTSVATWSLALTRYFFLDYDAGDDTRAGYIDAAANTTFTGAQTGAVAVKTFDRLLQILPRFGNGRRFNLLIKPRAAGATYRNQANTADADLDLRSLVGYRASIVRGSSDLTNAPTTDQVLNGWITASTGPNGDGSWSCAAGATTLDLTVAAGALPADLTGTGLRARMTGNVTAGLANQCRHVHSIVAGTLEVSTTWSAAPSGATGGDAFFLEKPGVAFKSLILGVSDPLNSGFTVASISFTATSGSVVSGSFTGGTLTLAGLHTTSTTLTSGLTGVVGSVIITRSYTCDDGTFRSMGGCRFAGPVVLTGPGASLTISSSSFLFAGSGRALRIQQAGQINIGQASPITAVAGILIERSAGAGSVSGNNVPAVIVGRGSTTTVPRVRVTASLSDGSGVLIGQGGGGVLLHGIDITGQGANSAIRLLADGAVLTIVDCTGTTGNTGVGLALSGAGNLLVLDVANTVSGTGGNIGCGGATGSVIATFADLAKTNVIDESGNRLINLTAGSIVPNCKVGQSTVVSNASGGALAVGDIVRTNGTTGQVTKAQGDSTADATGVVGVMVTAPANGALGCMVPPGCAPYVRFSGAPTAGALVYLDPTTAGQATTTVPAVAATNQKLRLGHHLRTVSGNDSVVAFHPELLPVLSDGIAP